MRILLTTPSLGGAGGVERAAFSIAHALKDDKVTIVYETAHGGPLEGVPKATKKYSSKNWRWRGAESKDPRFVKLFNLVINPLRMRFYRSFDASIALSPYSPNLSAAVTSRVTLLVPAGNPTTVLPRDVDVIAMESPSDSPSLTATVGAIDVLLPPPVVSVSPQAEVPLEPLPKRFFLTVFNPYDPVKGSDDLRKLLERGTTQPVVWCLSRATLSFDVPTWAIGRNDLHILEDASPAELNWLYAHCEAYLCFSRSEGFGWAVADALLRSPAIISRAVGVLKHPSAATLPGVNIINGPDWEYDLEHFSRAAPTERDLHWLSPEAYREALAKVLSDVRTVPAGRVRNM